MGDEEEEYKVKYLDAGEDEEELVGCPPHHHICHPRTTLISFLRLS